MGSRGVNIGLLKDANNKKEIATHNALVEAFKRLERGEPTIVKKGSPITAATVAREAQTDRTVLYKGHRDILERIRQVKIQRRQSFGKPKRNQKEAEIRIGELNVIIKSLESEKHALAQNLRSQTQLIEKLKGDMERVKDELRRFSPLRVI